MIVEHRTYTVRHGHMDDYLERFEQQGLPILMRHLQRMLGAFRSEIGPLNQVVYIWAYDSLIDMAQRRAALEADPEWHAFRLGNRGSFTEQETKVMKATAFSPRWV